MIIKTNFNLGDIVTVGQSNPEEVTILLENCEGKKQILCETIGGNMIYVSKEDLYINIKNNYEKLLKYFNQGDCVVIKTTFNSEFLVRLVKDIPFIDYSLIRYDCAIYNNTVETWFDEYPYPYCNYPMGEAIKEIRLATQEEKDKIMKIIYPTYYIKKS